MGSQDNLLTNSPGKAKKMKSLILRFGILLGVLVLVVSAGTIGFMIVENLSLLDAFYFTIVTVATVGYGDVHPISEAGKILSICLIVAGVGTFSAVIVSSAGLIFESRQDEVRRQRNNVLIGLFFSEIGTPLLIQFVTLDPGGSELRGQAVIRSDWKKRDFIRLSKQIVQHKYSLNVTGVALENLRSLLVDKTDFLVRLIESPSLLEHESFTELLLATIHLREELVARNTFEDLPETDITHLLNDSVRVFRLLTRRWVDYMHYLKNAYPYLFSLAMRNNPFNEKRSPIVK
jgi:voltage-gated potassium channel